MNSQESQASSQIIFKCHVCKKQDAMAQCPNCMKPVCSDCFDGNLCWKCHQEQNQKRQTSNTSSNQFSNKQNTQASTSTVNYSSSKRQSPQPQKIHNTGILSCSIITFIGLAVVIAITMMVAGQQKHLSGTYESLFGANRYTFYSNGTCETLNAINGGTLILNYKIVDGYTIKFTDPNEAPPRNKMEKDLSKMFAFDGTLSSDWKSFTILNVTYTKQ